MSRSRQRQPAQVKRAPPATLSDAIVVTKLTESAVRAIRETAAEYGLDGPSWDADVLHPEVMKVVASAMRRSTEWWAGRTEQEPPEASHAKREPGDAGA
jgi:hypothetical protein